jgi:SAM-dependent methyltransferase
MNRDSSRRCLWDERHERGETSDKPPEPVLVAAVAGMRPGSALDLACGLGRNSVFLAEHQWDVTAVDYSEIALSVVKERCDKIRTVQADLEHGEFLIEPGTYDLIVDCCFLHRPLFPLIRQGVRRGGLFVGVLPLPDELAQKPMNPAFLVQNGELLSHFDDWQVEHWREWRSGGDPSRRLRAELVARKPV